MKHWIAVLALCLAGLFALPQTAHAQESISEQVIRQLRAAGYDDITFNRTLLGRLRFIATSETRSREVVVHPTTGAILFDRGSDETGRVAPRVAIDDDDDGRGSREGNARGGRDDDGDDDDDRDNDRDDDDDNDDDDDDGGDDDDDSDDDD